MEVSSMSPDLKRALVEELVQGRDSATQLHLLLLHGSSASAHNQKHLLLSILKSFTQSLSLLTNNEVSDLRSQDSGGDSRKRPSFKGKMGSCKRRKNSPTWTTVTPTNADGQAWRKYGQKTILNAKYPRAYFRCRSKYNQGCGATKHVQRLDLEDDDDSQMFMTTYVGIHTCRSMARPDHNVSELDLTWGSGESSGNHQSKLLGVKYETNDSDNMINIDSILWPDVLPLDSTEHNALMPDELGCEVAASSMVHSFSDTASQSLDMGFVVDSVDFESVSGFSFDEDVFV